MMAPKIQEDENIVNNNNNKTDGFKLNIEDTTAVVHGGNTDSNSTNNRYLGVKNIFE